MKNNIDYKTIVKFDEDKRYDLIKQGFKVLYPNAIFIVANKEKYFKLIL